MFKITMNFDSRKFQRDLENEMRDAAKKQLRSKLRDLSAKGLRVSFQPSNASHLNIQLDGPAELIDKAKRRLE